MLWLFRRLVWRFMGPMMADLPAAVDARLRFLNERRKDAPDEVVRAYWDGAAYEMETFAGNNGFLGDVRVVPVLPPSPPSTDPAPRTDVSLPCSGGLHALCSGFMGNCVCSCHPED